MCRLIKKSLQHDEHYCLKTIQNFNSSTCIIIREVNAKTIYKLPKIFLDRECFYFAIKI